MFDFYDCGFFFFSQRFPLLQSKLEQPCSAVALAWAFYGRLIGLSWDSNWPQTDTTTGAVWSVPHRARVKKKKQLCKNSSCLF